MKKILLISGIVAIIIWISGYFIFKLTGAIHIMLVLGLLLYIRSLMYVPLSATERFYRARTRR